MPEYTLMVGSNRLAERAVALSLMTTIIVVAVKLIAAKLSGSISVLAEGLQSTIDICISALALWTVRYASKPPDDEHPYGHGKAELLTSALQMFVVLLTSSYILYESWRRFSTPQAIEWSWGAWAMAYATVSNISVIWYLARVNHRTDSEVVRSEALHLRSDTIATLGVLIGMLVVGATGVIWMDPLVAAFCALTSMTIAIKQLISVVHPLMDGALPTAELDLLEHALAKNSHVRGFHDVRTRRLGNTKVVELHVMLEDDLSFVRAHEIAEEIESQLREVLHAKFVSIHYEPYEAEMRHREIEHARPPTP